MKSVVIIQYVQALLQKVGALLQKVYVLLQKCVNFYRSTLLKELRALCVHYSTHFHLFNVGKIGNNLYFIYLSLLALPVISEL